MTLEAASFIPVSAQIIAGILGLTGAVTAAVLTVFVTRRTDARRHIAQYATDAYADLLVAAARNNVAATRLEDAESDESRLHWTKELGESTVVWSGAQLRLATFGSREAVAIVAEIQRHGGFQGSDPAQRARLVQLAQQLQKDLGQRRVPVRSDLDTVMF